MQVYNRIAIMNHIDIKQAYLTGIFMAIKALWPILVLLLIMAIVKIIYVIYENNKLKTCGIYEIDRMGGRVFEKYLNVLFKQLGYNVKLTQYVGDWGADLIIMKNGYKTVVQAKRYKNKVGVKAVQEVCAARGKYDCQNALVVTNSYYTKPAIELARANNVQLWNRNKLIASLSQIQNQQ